MTKRFRRSYRKASVPLQRLIEGATHDLVRGFREMRGEVKRRYDRLKHLQPKLSLLEIDVSGANRMVANVERDSIHLLDVGGHETVPRYTFGKYQVDKHQSEPVHNAFWPEGGSQELKFFTRNPCRSIAEFGTETKPEWLYFLSAQQSEVLDEAIEHVFAADEGAGVAPVFIVGGPGTGKTSILINMLKQAIDLGIDARMRCSERMKTFILAAAPGMNAELLVSDGDEGALRTAELLIVDDPDNKAEIMENLCTWSARNQQLAVVIGFDPCQLSDFDTANQTSGLSDETFDAFVSATSANVFGLDECYRQKANVGSATQKALRMLADSSPFLADQKIERFRYQHIGVNSLGHDFCFPNPNGYLQVYEPWTPEDLKAEIERIQSQSQWVHWPSTLIVVDDDYRGATDTLTATFSNAGLHCETTQLCDVGSVKGLEYQHLILFLSKGTFQDLENGFHGSGQAKYAKYRMMRIPLSRPKDSKVVFVSG